MNEEAIFSQGDFNFTKTLVRIGATSYPVNGIGSVLVKPREIQWKALAAAVVAALIGFSAVGSKDGAAIGLVALAVAAALAFFAFSRPDTLVLRTASGDQDALASRDKDLMNKVKAAIEVAVAKRG
jgi:Family of unknown function (DUF6232)